MRYILEDAAHQRLTNDKQAQQYVHDFRHGALEPYLRNVFDQSGDDRFGSVADDFHAAELVQQFRRGNIAVVSFGTAQMVHGPRSDCDRAGNRAMLGSLAPDLHVEVFAGHGEGADGVVAWRQPIDMFVHDPKTGELREHRVAPSSAPLEIGSMPGCTAKKRMMVHSCLARWPYESNVVTLCVLLHNPWREALGRGLCPS